MHVLLVGIDAYGGHIPPLNGCVNDIDAVQRILVDRLGVDRAQITRLTAPHEGTVHEADVPSAPATRENLVRALAKLGSETVKPEDRVFIYYSGHGAAITVEAAGTRAAREGLVPADAYVDEQEVPRNLLLDLEINALLRGIAGRTQQVTFILDCCHSAGATRAAFDKKGDATRAFVVSKPVPAAALEGGEGLKAAPGIGGQRGSVDDCLVVAACLADEKALECDDDEGRKHGLLTQKLVTLLRAVEPKDLADLTWGRIWRSVVAEMGASRPQHASLMGSYARRVFSGPPTEGDSGHGVTRLADGTYKLDAGTLVGITEGAKVAVYGSAPAHFPAVGSPEDLAARVGMLKVTKAAKSSVVAEPEGAPFDLPQGARARVVERGAVARIAVGLSPHDDVLAEQIKGSRMARLAEPGETPAVKLERCADGHWALTDAVFGKGEIAGEPVLARIPPTSLTRAGTVLDYYVRYSEPLRMAELCTNLPGALAVTFLDCNGAKMDEDTEILQGIDPATPGLPEVPLHADGMLACTSEDKIAVQVRNTSSANLDVWLFDCSTEGQVFKLGKEVIGPGQTHVFWRESTLGKPIFMGVPEGRDVGVERLVAIGTTARDKSLDHLTMDAADDTFEAVLTSTRGMGGRPMKGPPEEQWTATRLMVRVRAKA
jgi:hypothetical protein